MLYCGQASYLLVPQKNHLSRLSSIEVEEEELRSLKCKITIVDEGEAGANLIGSF
jgi:hypothetical protein